MRERKSSHSFFHSTKSLQCHGWPRLKMSVGNSTLVRHVNNETPLQWTVTCCFLGFRLESETGAGYQMWDAGVLTGILADRTNDCIYFTDTHIYSTPFALSPQGHYASLLLMCYLVFPSQNYRYTCFIIHAYHFKFIRVSCNVIYFLFNIGNLHFPLWFCSFSFFLSF